jgi:hypothetical protein
MSVIRTDIHNNKHHFRHHVVPEKNEGLDIGLTGQRFATGRFATIFVDTLNAITSSISTLLTLTTGLTLSFLGAGVVHTDASGVVSTGPVDLGSEVSGDLPFANLTQGSALSVLGVTGNATADVASIAAANDKEILRRSGTAVAFGSIDLAASGAVGTSVLAVANGGTNAATAAAARTSLAVAPLDPQYVTLATNSELSNERVLTAGTGITFVDGGAGSTITVSVTGGFSNPIATQVFGG